MLNWKKHAKRIAKSVFGYKSLRPLQYRAIESIVNLNHTFVLASTGGGKSACFQIPAVMLSGTGTCIVFSPLIALMHDQVQKLKAWGIKAECVVSSTDDYETRKIIRNIGRYEIVYVAPERLTSTSFIEALKKANLSFIVVDEAHCLSLQMRDFRPAYMQMGRIIRKHFKHVPCMALTATADSFIENDIIRVLGMWRYNRFTNPPIRPNLTYKVVKDWEPGKIGDFIRKGPYVEHGSVVVYASTRARVDEIADKFVSRGLSAEAYHAGMAGDHRTAVQDRFMSGETKIIVATNAFGMGIDKSDVRLVFHADPPGDVMAYAQESGRAGRDGLPALCVLNVTEKGLRSRRFFIRAANPKFEAFEIVWDELYKKHRLGEAFIINTNEVKRKIQFAGGVSSFEAPFMVESLLSYLEYIGSIVRKTDKAVYRLDVKDMPAALRWRSRNPGQIKIEEGRLRLTVRPGDEDFAPKLVKLGVVHRPDGGPRPITFYRTLRRRNAHGVDESDLADKREHDENRLRTLLLFAGSADKHAFIASVFGKPKAL